MSFLPIHPDPLTVQFVKDKYSNNNKAVDELIRKCVHAILMLSQGGKEVVSKTILSGLVFPQGVHHTVNKAIIEIANKQLVKVFGMRLYEMDLRYLVVNASPEDADLIEYDEEETTFYAVLHLILIDIFGCTEEKLTIDEIEHHLEHLKIKRTKLEDLVSRYKMKFYLAMIKEDCKEYYKWGQRAVAEVDPDGFFESFLSLYGGDANDYPDLSKRIDTLKRMTNR